MFFLPYLYKFLVYRKNFDIVIYQRDKVDESQGYLVSGFFVCGVGMCGVGYLGMPLMRGAIFVW
jgi:hypothetical protein